MASLTERLKLLLKGIETGDPAAAAVVNEDKYIQHNPRTREGSKGLAELFARLAKTKPRVTFVRLFEDGDFAFAHNEYDFNGIEVAFEVFRFEHGQAVEHWDNIQAIQAPNPSGRTMLDGETVITDKEKTEVNRGLVSRFAQRVLVDRNYNEMEEYVCSNLIQHAPDIADSATALRDWLQSTRNETLITVYSRVHRILAEGNYVLCMSEGEKAGVHTSFFDLFRLTNSKISEHWNTVSTIPPKSEWKNDNGKF